MIIQENINSPYESYQEENYDYLFRRKSKEQRRQTKTVKKAKREEKKQGIKKSLVPGNFGLFNKNRKKQEALAKAEVTPGLPAMQRTDAASASAQEEKQTDKTTEALAGAALAGMAGSLGSQPGGGTSGSGANPGSTQGKTTAEETQKQETQNKEQDKKDKQETSFGAILGFACLGFTVFIAGFALYKADKKSRQLSLTKIAA